MCKSSFSNYWFLMAQCWKLWANRLGVLLLADRSFCLCALLLLLPVCFKVCCVVGSEMFHMPVVVTTVCWLPVILNLSDHSHSVAQLHTVCAITSQQEGFVSSMLALCPWASSTGSGWSTVVARQLWLDWRDPPSGCEILLSIKLYNDKESVLFYSLTS